MISIKNKFNLLRTLFLTFGTLLLLSGYNSASAALVSVGGTITDTTWDAANTYQVTTNLTLSTGCTLTIPTGTVVKFNPGISMTVYGNLQAVGTVGNEIYFTSRDDDTVGSGANLSDHNPTKGDWDKISMTTGSDSSILENVIIKYPQIGIHTYNAATAFTVRNSTVTGSVQMGIYSYNNGASTISGNTISNGLAIGIYINGSGSQTITNNTVTNNVTGISIGTSTAKTLTNNTITYNTGKGLECYSETVNFNGNNFSGNAKPSRFCTIEPLLNEDPTNTTYNDVSTFFEVNSIKMPSISIGTLPKLSGPVVLYGGTLDTGKTLTITPGNIFRMYIGTTASIDIAGNLQAIGTASEPIVFTSKNDNTAGGALTGSTISTSNPTKGDWGKINMTTGSDSSVLENVIIKYPQIGIHTLNVATAFTLRNSTITETVQMGIYSYNNGIPTISGNTISNGLTIGIYIYGSGNQLISNNTVINNVTGIKINLSTAKTITNNTIENNTGKGLECYSETVIFSGNNFSGNSLPSRFCTIEPLLNEDPTNTTYNDVNTFFEVNSIKMPLISIGTLPKLSGPVVLYGGTLDTGKTLTITPGNIFRMYIGTTASIDIAGNLQAIGTASEPIVFTSKNDNTAGGALTGSTISTSNPTKGDWGKINMTTGSDSSVLENVIIKYPQIGIHTYNVATAFTLRNSTITETVQMGIYSWNNGASTISGNTILNGLAIGIYINGSGNQTITNNTVINNLTGINIGSSTTKTITNNTIVKNTGVGIYISNLTAIIKNNISHGNNFGIQCTSTMTITYNLFYNNTSGTQNGTYCTIGETNKTTSDPLFVDYVNSNYRLQATSPAINAGDPTMGVHPLSGDYYDIGAYEYYIAGITRASEATISNPDGRTLEYIWTFTSDPSGGGVAKPVFIGAYTGTTSDISKTVSCNYTIKYKGDYHLKLSLSESGSLVKESDYGLIVE